MSHDHKSSTQLSMNPVALSSYSVAICALGAAPISLVFKDFPGVGLAAVGGFYLVVAVASHLFGKSAPQKGLVKGLSEHTSGADNLVAEAVAGSRETATQTGELVGSVH